jgi:CheY-like chemotaxis protein
MALPGPILIIEDDSNDADVMATAIRELGIKNEVKIFYSAQEALEYLTNTTDKPFVILSDIRMPGLDGYSFLKSIKENDYLRKKAIPFLFFTGIVSSQIVDSAYELGIQGYYKKAGNYTGIKDQLLSILIYWNQCIHPNIFEKER